MRRCQRITHKLRNFIKFSQKIVEKSYKVPYDIESVCEFYWVEIKSTTRLRGKCNAMELCLKCCNYLKIC